MSHADKAGRSDTAADYDRGVDPEARRSRIAPLSLGLAALVGASLAYALGLTPWLLPAVSGVLIVVAVSRLVPWAWAFSSVVIAFLAVAALFARVSPYTGGLVATSTCVLAVGGIAALAVALWAPRRAGTASSRDLLARAWPVAVVPGALLASLAAITIARGAPVSWAMRNDAVWNVIAARFLVADGGLVPALHGSSAPMTTVLLGLAMAPGRSAVAAADLLGHDVHRGAEMWIVAAALTSLLAGVVAVIALRDAPKPVRILATIVSAGLPLTWYAFGLAITFGFYNATLSLVLALAAWIVWQESARRPLSGAAVLGVASVATLATWPPLAALPAALALAILLPRMRAVLRSPRHAARWIAAALPLPLYAVFITLPDLQRDGGALAADGGITPISFVRAVLSIAGMLLVILWVARRHRDSRTTIGIVAVSVAMTIGVAYLAAQRLGLADLWGYYPIKMTWIVLSLLLVITVPALVASVLEVRGRPVLQGIAGVAAVAILGGLLVQVPVLDFPAASRRAPVLEILTNTRVSGSEMAAAELFSIAQPDVKAMVVRSASDDVFINSWLLQLQSPNTEDPIRTYSYYFDSSDLRRVCQAISVWGGTVTVHTRDPALRAELDATCPSGDYIVVVDGS